MTTRIMITILAALVISSQIATPRGFSATEVAELQVLYSNNVEGEIEPCG